jgi:hypothetical protein
MVGVEAADFDSLSCAAARPAAQTDATKNKVRSFIFFSWRRNAV